MKHHVEFTEQDTPSHHSILIRVPKEVWDAGVVALKKQSGRELDYDAMMQSENQINRSIAALRVVTTIGYMKESGK